MAGGKTSYLMVRILGDATGATKALAQVDAGVGVLDASLGKSKGAWKGWAGAAAAALTVVGIAASNASQAAAAMEDVWKDQTDEMTAFTESMDELGLSSTQAAEASIFFGSVLQNLGFTLEQTAVLTQKLIVLALDMAAAMNYTVPQAILALSGAMRGEYEAIEKFGIILNQAAVEAQILEMELNGVTFASEQQAKVAAILTLVWEGTAWMHGQATEEMNTLRGASIDLMASVKNLAKEVGLLAEDELQGLIEGVDRTIEGFSLMIEEGGLLDAALDLTQTFVSELTTLLQPGLGQAIGWVDEMFGKLGGMINETIIPAVQNLMGWLDNLIGKMREVAGAVRDMGVEITSVFEKLVDSAPDLSSTEAQMASMARLSRQIVIPTTSATGRAGPGQHASSTITINVQAGVGDPHAIAREIRRVLQQDAVRMGRAA